jgi:hypothetical protein
MSDVEYHRSRYDVPKAKGFLGVPPGVLIGSLLIVSIMMAVLLFYLQQAKFKLKPVDFSDEAVDVEEDVVVSANRFNSDHWGCEMLVRVTAVELRRNFGKAVALQIGFQLARGAIIITSQKPTDEFSGSIKAGIDNGFGWNVRAGISGPLSDTVKYRMSGSYRDTKGYLPNTFLKEDADPVKDLSLRGNLLFEPGNGWTADLRASYAKLETQALYFNIVNDVNDVSLPVRVNNAGINNRDLHTLEVDPKTTEKLYTLIPKAMPGVVESGLRSRQDVSFLKILGVSAVLIGSVFMESENIRAKVEEIMGW